MRRPFRAAAVVGALAVPLVAGPGAGGAASAATAQAACVYGEIGALYARLGGPNGFLGRALTCEQSTPHRFGRFNHFQGGSIYWSPQTGAHEIHGAIRERWAAMGWENSVLGFPTSDEYSEAGGARRSDFEHGRIVWTPNSIAVVAQRIRGNASATSSVVVSNIP